MKVQLQIFNRPSKNGRIYSAKNQEEVFDFFNKKFGLFLTSQDQTLIKKTDNVIDMSKIIAKFDKIEVKDTGDIGYNGYPVFEVFADIREDSAFNEKFKPYAELLENNTATFGMRAVGTVSKDSVAKIEQVICIDMITK